MLPFTPSLMRKKRSQFLSTNPIIVTRSRSLFPCHLSYRNRRIACDRLQIGVELQLPSPHEWASTYWYWDYVMTTKIMTEASLRESKEQLEAVKAQMEVQSSLCRPYGGTRFQRTRVNGNEKYLISGTSKQTCQQAYFALHKMRFLFLAYL